MTPKAPISRGRAPKERAPKARRPASVWSGRQLTTRIVGIVLIGVVIVTLHFTGVLGGLQQRFFPPAVNWSSDYSVVEYLRRLVRQDGLTKVAKTCLLFVINGNDPHDAQRMEVWGKQGGACAGVSTSATSGAKPGAKSGPKPGAPPVLFTLLVDHTRHTVQSDLGSPGHFHALR